MKAFRISFTDGTELCAIARETYHALGKVFVRFHDGSGLSWPLEVVREVHRIEKRKV